VIGGDLNDGPRAVDAAFDGVLVGATALTYPGATPSRAIDHVLATRVAGWEAEAIDLGRCHATRLEHGQCSDHRALVATLVLG
jgi:endonuclease/exonuclease/phosphatase family metal-dependent hydrolase